MPAKNTLSTAALALTLIGLPGMAGEAQPDPGYKEQLAQARFPVYGWKTDFSRHTVPFSEIMSGGVPRDGIPPVDNPKFTTIMAAGAWLGEHEPVIALVFGDQARAYPLQIMTWHEIVNDVVAGVPVTVTFCPLCNSAVAFERRLEGTVYDFGVSGNLRNSDLIMWDRQTESWWQQFTGEAMVGALAGKRLKFVPVTIVAWADFKAAHPQGSVLSRDTGHSRSYGENPYVGYDRVDSSPFLFDGKLDGRLLPKERVVAVTVGNADAAFPFSALKQERVVHDTLNGQDLVVFYRPGARSALGERYIASAEDVGAAAVFDPWLGGKKLTFRADGDGFVDQQTGSRWNILGEAKGGPLAGQKLAPIVHANHFWFAWAAFKPNTKVYERSG